MPYRSYTPYRRTGVPSKPPPVVPGIRRRTKTAWGKATQALRLARSLALRTESKVNYYVATSSDMFTGPFVYNLCQIAQGDAGNQRAGLQVNAERLDLRIRSASFVHSNMSFRYIVFQDLQQVLATSPAVTDVLIYQRTTSNYNQINRNRFKILSDRTVTMNANFLNQDIVRDMRYSVRGFARAGKIGFSDLIATNVNLNGLYIMVLADYAQVDNCNTPIGALDEAQVTIEAILHYSDA